MLCTFSCVFYVIPGINRDYLRQSRRLVGRHDGGLMCLLEGWGGGAIYIYLFENIKEVEKL